MKKTRLAVSMLFLLFQSLVFISQVSAMQSTETNNAIKNILVDRIDNQKQSVSIVIGIIDDKGSRIISYGKSDKTANKTVDGDSVYEIGSITKVFTGILLADMVERGEVKLDDPISKYLPSSVKAPTLNGKEITSLHLANHTSGLPRMPSNFSPKNPENPYVDYTVEHMYTFLSNYTLTRNIGERYEYSNLGFGILGHILALRAGMDYEKLIQTRIIDPLKMSSTGITLTPDMKTHLAYGHNNKLDPVSNWDVPTFAGAGALRSSTNDMLKFVAANLGLITTRLQTAMQKSHISQPSPGQLNYEVGLGWQVTKSPIPPITWHIGGTGGYRSFIGFNKVKRIGIVVLSNSVNSTDDIGFHLINSQYQLLKGRVEINIDPKLFDTYVGEYEVGPNFILTISRMGSNFFAQTSGGQKLNIYPENETDFFLKVDNIQLKFKKDEKGIVTHLTLYQIGVLKVCKRIK